MINENALDDPCWGALNSHHRHLSIRGDLAVRYQPGPMLSRTIEMGQYLGIRHQGQLIAMAGQRLHLTGFCEISAVCTHPDYRGNGYAGALSSMLARSIMERNETPILHVVPTNDSAIRLYTKLGFRKRKDIPLTILKRIA